MALVKLERVIGAHVQFAPEGTTSLSGAVTRDIKPASDDPIWTTYDVGDVADFKPERFEESKKTLFVPSPGVYVPSKRLTEKSGMKYNITLQAMTAFIIGIFYRAATVLDATSGQFNPMAGVCPQGWMKFTHLDHTNNYVLIGDLWCDIDVASGIDAKPEHSMPVIEVVALANDLNTFFVGQ